MPFQNNMVGFGAALENELWLWGANGQGQHGVGNTINTSSPIQMEAGKDWGSISIGAGATMGGVTADGELFMWGNNTNGELGQGDTNVTGSGRRSSPVQLGS